MARDNNKTNVKRVHPYTYAGIKTIDLTIDEYYTKSCKILGTTDFQMKRKKKTDDLVQKRVAIVLQLKKVYPKETISKIGSMIGRDHVTVIYYRDRIDKKPEYYEYITKLNLAL